MIVRTRVFDIYKERYESLAEPTRAMDISVSQIYRVHKGIRPVNQKFIVGAMKTFPDCRLDNLFYLVPDS